MMRLFSRPRTAFEWLRFIAALLGVVGGGSMLVIGCAAAGSSPGASAPSVASSAGSQASSDAHAFSSSSAGHSAETTFETQGEACFKQHTHSFDLAVLCVVHQHKLSVSSAYTCGSSILTQQHWTIDSFSDKKVGSQTAHTNRLAFLELFSNQCLAGNPNGTRGSPSASPTSTTKG